MSKLSIAASGAGREVGGLEGEGHGLALKSLRGAVAARLDPCHKKEAQHWRQQSVCVGPTSEGSLPASAMRSPSLMSTRSPSPAASRRRGTSERSSLDVLPVERRTSPGSCFPTSGKAPGAHQRTDDSYLHLSVPPRRRPESPRTLKSRPEDRVRVTAAPSLLERRRDRGELAHRRSEAGGGRAGNTKIRHQKS